jgi:NMD protein affecting ribosome stability and mRNA decay
MVCYSCNKQKNELNPKTSDILDGVQLFLCQTCLELKHEPRWVIILAGRKNGADSVRDYVVKRLYTGKIITAEELIA